MFDYISYLNLIWLRLIYLDLIILLLILKKVLK